MRVIPSPFKPTKLPTCGLWLEADRGITLDGSSLVSAMADQSGNARHAAQADPTKRMQYLPTGFNGHPCLQGASGKGLVNSTMGIAAGLTGLTFISVFQLSSVDLNNIVLVADADNRVFSMQTYQSKWIAYAGTNNYGEVAGGTNANRNIYVSVFDGNQTGNANRLKLRINGVQQTLDFGTRTIPASLPACAGYAIGRPYSTEGYNTTGKIAVPAIMYPYALSLAQCQRIERAYGSKYGITVA